MGFFDSSSSSTKNLTTISNTTTTKVGDVGITGAQAQGIFSKAADVLNNTGRNQSNAFQTFAGAVTHIADTALGYSFSDLSKARATNAQSVSLGYNAVSQQSGNLSNNMTKTIMYVALAMAAVFLVKGKL